MHGSRRGRLAALAAALALATGLLALLPGTPTAAAPRGECPETTLLPTDPCDTTTSQDPTTSETTTTFVDTTSTSFLETSTTRGDTPGTNEVVETTTSTSLEVTTSNNVLVPGDGTEGAESTTTTTVTPTTVSNDSDTSDGALVALVVGGLVLLAVVVGILTWRYWVATRPPPSSAVGSDHG